MTAVAADNGSVRRLVIVESPTKARKIAGYLGSNYIVESSRGHIRDLPRAAADVPAKYKSEPWARLGVNVDDDFEPLYIISPDKKSTVAELKDLLKDVDELYLATDGDREGEAIAWHLLETLKPTHPGQADGVPRDHRAGDPRRRRGPARSGHRPGRRAGDPPHPGPAVRLRGQPGAVEEGRAEAVGRPRAVRGDPHHRAARAGADGVPQRRLLGRHRRARRERLRRAGLAADVHGQARTRVDGRRVATGRDFDSLGGLKQARRGAGARRGRGRRAGRRTARRAAHGVVGRAEAVHPQALRAVHDLDAAAGGGPQAAVLVGAHDEHRAAALRERLHHLYAYRLDDAVGSRRSTRRAPRPASCTARSTCTRRRGSTPARSRTRRRRTRPSGPPAMSSRRRASCTRSWTPTSSGSTS